MLLFGLDFETTGLDPKIHSIVEVGAFLYDTDHTRIVKQMGYIVDNPEAVWEDEAMAVTHLNADICRQYGHDPERSLKQLLNVFKYADAIVTHNGLTCDKPYLEAWCAKFGVELPEKLWIDTMVDIIYPQKWNRQLTCLAAYHGFINPFPHGALADALTTLLLVLKYPLDGILERARSPLVGVQALVSYDDKDKAKTRGYFAHYENNKFRMWVKNMKEIDVAGEREEAPFAIEIVPPVK